MRLLHRRPLPPLQRVFLQSALHRARTRCRRPLQLAPRLQCLEALRLRSRLLLARRTLPLLALQLRLQLALLRTPRTPCAMPP